MNLLVKLLLIAFPLLIGYWIFDSPQFDHKTIRGKRVLVTGASSGIGEEVAYQYAKLGTKLVITARRANLLEDVARKCQELGAEKVIFIVGDMASASDRKKIVDVTIKSLGGIDILIQNHGIIDVQWWKGRPEDVKYFQHLMNVNFISHVDLTSMCLKTLEENRGAIGIVSSIAGKFSGIGFGQYAAAKHALHGFYGALRQELNYKNTGISVTLIVFGAIDTKKATDVASKFHSNDDFKKAAAPIPDAALALISGVSARVYEVYHPRIATIITTSWKIAPGYFEDFWSWYRHGRYNHSYD